ncbi:hypothetical protein M514_04444 [Trichuris suis]|uniref:Reverse transcriptase Ty1/copia-type domain-containing protein n=1 Tax=Trichuris suis TaxID=68888 RepID=A0A085MZ25_9BILA|nr:hypothetical protein M513_04444 [Trichuris suis]KFD62471.1 hypothetical protein M514_04444 [Trichuris suis]
MCMGCKIVNRQPMEICYLDSPRDESTPLPNNSKYRQAIGSLLYLTTVSRPGIAVAVGLLSRRVEAPRECDWKAVKRIMRYMAATIDKRLRLSGDDEVILNCFVDADWAGDKTDRKSTTGYVVRLGKCALAWSSQKQSAVALSFTEAEYIAASQTCREILWLRRLLDDTGIPQREAAIIYEDNQGCIRVAETDRCSARTKHIDLRCHLLPNLRDQRIINLEYCPSEDMIVDIQ